MILFFILFATAMMALPSFFIYMALKYPVSANPESQKQSPAVESTKPQEPQLQETSGIGYGLANKRRGAYSGPSLSHGQMSDTEDTHLLHRQRS
ncbi:hypothetical protein IWX49DRAFT_561233 [Phyllosticta citricarpa]|uniref:Uncharacterized protein n=1 Tax=Phyllosticta citricarpa TaxID=55181 RepID=A0ABR1MQQ3_9PEZI